MTPPGNISAFPGFQPVARVMRTIPHRDRAPLRLPLENDMGHPGEVHGVLDGDPIIGTNGLRVERRQINGARVTSAQLAQALEGLAQLPAHDLDLVAQAGIPIRLVPAAHLEYDRLGRPLLGATTVESSGSSARVTMVRVAVNAGRSGSESTGEVLQHELGHAINVLKSGDESERAAEAYAARY